MQLQSWYEPFTKNKPVDSLAFLGQWPFRLSARFESSDLTEQAQRLAISQYLMSHIASIYGHDTRTGNEALFLDASRDARILPFIILNPSEKTWEQELLWAHASGAKGIRLLPGYHGYALTDGCALACIEAVRELRLPISVCVKLQDERLQHPDFRAPTPSVSSIAQYIRAGNGHPMLFHGLSFLEYNSIQLQLNWNEGLEHVYFDLWFINAPGGVIQDIVTRGMAERFVYSSCSPIQTAEATALQIANADITDEDRYALCRGNVLKYLQLSE